MKVVERKMIILLVSICIVVVVAGEDGNDGTKQFDMGVRFDSLTSDKKDSVVVKSGVVQPKWSICGQGEECETRIFSEYSEQVILEFSYDDLRKFNFQKPSIKTSGGRANAEMMEYSHDIDERSGEIIVVHNCDNGNDKTESRVELSFPIVSGKVIKFGWKKICGSGKHELLDYGIMSRGVKDGALSLRESREEVVFGPGVLSSRVYLKLERGYSQKFKRPVVTIERIRGKRIGMSVDVKGSGFGDMVMGGTISVFDIFYNCDEGGLWRVYVDVGIPPFRGVEMRWMKDCGGGIEESLNIGTRRGIMDIVKNGMTSEEFNKSGRSGVTGKGSGTKAFFVTITPKKTSIGSLSIGEISAHSYTPRIGNGVIAGINKMYERSPWGITSLSENGEVIRGKVDRMIGVSVQCLRKGMFKIGVRISVHDREAIEFWFWNECYGKSEIVVTAEKVTYVMLCLLCGIMLLTIRKKKI